ncbi:MAG: hypothetical protein OEY29_15360 [Gammaproteobacteria bacterium]|nr:hypothetical protein [Gammaproteobacteria bacterium]
MVSHTVLLTDIIEAGDSSKKNLYRDVNNNTPTKDEEVLKRQINSAIERAMPVIKHRLQQELLAALTAK